MALVEYLYVDSRRLDAYIEQLGSPVTYDKIPVWSAELSVTGPKATASQGRYVRPLTQHERITKLLDYLHENKLVDTDRPSGLRLSHFDDSQPNDFVYENCAATRIFIPPRSQDVSGLTLWISQPLPCAEFAFATQRQGMLCLLEDFRKADEPPASIRGSAYTVLAAIILAIGKEANHLVVSDLFDESESWQDIEQRPGAYHRVARHWERFMKDPVGLFESVGCKAGRPRNIRVLYRIRENGLEGSDEYVSIFGYPIFIAAAA